MHLLLGPELQEAVLHSLKVECSDVDDSTCIEVIKTTFESDKGDLAFKNDDNSLEPRKLPGGLRAQLAVAAAAAVMGLFEKLEPARGVPVDIHLPADVLSELEDASTASEMVFKTADEDASPISAKLTPTPVDINSSPLKTLTADENGHAKGDIEIDAPSEEVAKAINDFFGESKCQLPISKRKNNLKQRKDEGVAECLLNGFENLLNAMAAEGPLNGLAKTAAQVAQDFPLPTFDDPQYAAAFGRAVAVGGEVVPRVITGISQNRILAAITLVFFLSAANVRHELMNGGKIVLSQKSLVKFSNDSHATCPTENRPKCNLFVCQGKDGKCTTPPLASCPCDEDDKQCPEDEDDWVSSPSGKIWL